jgi:hypothetical protein
MTGKPSGPAYIGQVASRPQIREGELLDLETICHLSIPVQDYPGN